MVRQSWDEYFMGIAEHAAGRATCNRLQVGAVIMKDNKIVSTGYNGSIHGEPHCTDAGCLLNEQGRCIRTIHAEQNAIIHASRDEMIGATIYCTHAPCETCTKLVAQSGIVRAVFRHDYNNPYNQHFNAGMEWVHLAKETV